MMKLVAIFSFLLAAPIVSGYSCKDQNNNDVDWFIAYKYPEISGHADPMVIAGKRFLYLDANTKADGFKESPVAFDQTNQAIAYTIQQVYDHGTDSDVFHVMYNDDGPCPSNDVNDSCDSDGYRAHAKGTALFGSADGFWLTHSVPKFPTPDQYLNKQSTTQNGQTFLCVTFNTGVLTELSEQWFRYRLNIYSSNLPTAMAQTYPLLQEIINDVNMPSTYTYERAANLTSKGGKAFRSFAKDRRWGEHFWKSLVAPGLGEDIFVSSWMSGTTDLSSGCTFEGQTVWTVREVKLNGTTFLNSKDHSKWAMAYTGYGEPYVCIGDINNMRTQDVRGGGALCMSDCDVRSAFSTIVTQKETPPTDCNAVADGSQGAQVPYVSVSDPVYSTVCPDPCVDLISTATCTDLAGNHAQTISDGVTSVAAYFCANSGVELCKVSCDFCTPSG